MLWPCQSCHLGREDLTTHLIYEPSQQLSPGAGLAPTTRRWLRCTSSWTATPRPCPLTEVSQIPKQALVSARALRPTLGTEHPVDGCKPCRTAGIACCCLRHSRGCMLRIRCMEGSTACWCHQKAWSGTPRSPCAAAHTLQTPNVQVLGSSPAAAPAPPGCTLMWPLSCSSPTRLDLGQADACGMVQRATAASLRALATRGMCASGVQAWGAAGGRHSQGQR